MMQIKIKKSNLLSAIDGKLKKATIYISEKISFDKKALLW